MTDQTRQHLYERTYEQLKDLIEGKSPDLTAAMSTICAVLHHKMGHHFWTGFYLVEGENELHIGPYQGPVACQVLQDSGVCLHCASTKEPVVVSDVEGFPGHIACDPRSKSEIALPVMKGRRVVAVLDIDSDRPNQFSADDIAPLTKILSLLEPYL